MSLSISQLKDELISAGLSVKTPGLTGEDRFEELKHRLDMHQKKMKVKLSEESKGESNSGSELSNSAIGSLSIGELRSRLASLGENTSTPGLAGEERRSELMKRLVNAVCGDDVASSEIIENASKYSEEYNDMPSIVYRPTPVPLHAPPPPQVVIKEEPKVDISELKKQMKRIQNKRAIFVAGKLSGKSMDPLLKQSETSLKAIEAEISFFKSMINKTEPTYKNEVSSAFVDLGSDGKIEAETVLRQLEAIRVDIKDDIREHRLRVRDEGDNHEEYGVAVEELLKIKMSDANLSNNTSRTRKKFDQMKQMELALRKLPSEVPPTVQVDEPRNKISSENNDVEKSNLKVSITREDQLHEYAANDAVDDKQKNNVSSDSNEEFNKYQFGIGLASTDSYEDSVAYPSEDGHHRFVQADSSNHSSHGTSSAIDKISIYDSKDLIDTGGYRDPIKNKLGLPMNVEQLYNSYISPNSPDKSVQSAKRDGRFDLESNSEEIFRELNSKDSAINAFSPLKGSCDDLDRHSLCRSADTLDYFPQGDDRSETSHALLETIPENNFLSSEISGDEVKGVYRSNIEDSVIAQEANLNEISQAMVLYNGSVDEDFDEDETEQIRILRQQARVLESLAEILLERALELDPTNILTLEAFAVFLHQKKGEVGRAEAFLNRGLQLCMPSMRLQGSSKEPTPKEKVGFNSSKSFEEPQKEASSIKRVGIDKSDTLSAGEGYKVKHVVKFLLSFAKFMAKARGDIEAACSLYKRALAVDGENPVVLGSYAHFLAHEGEGSKKEAERLFKKSLKINPNGAQVMLWYAKLLKRIGRSGQAELMYKVAYSKARENPKLEPTAICNYATFLFKVRKNPEAAQVMFADGINRFPSHKGLIKNYCTLLKANKHLGNEDEIRSKTPGSIMDRLNRKLNSKANDLDDDESIEVKSEIILEKMNVTLPSTAHSSQSRRRNRQGTIDSLDSGIAMADKLEDFGLATVGNYKNNGGELQNASEMRNDEGDEESDDDAMVKSFPARPTPLPGRRNETNLEPLITTVSLKRTPPPPSSKNKTSWADTDEAKRLFYTDSKSNLGHSLDSPSQRNQVVKNPQKLQATNSFLAAVEPVKSHRGRNFAVELDDDDSD